MVEIIPKQTQKASPWQDILFYASLLLLVAVIVAFLAIIYSQKKSYQTLKVLDRKIASKQTLKEKEMKATVINYQKKINDFSVLLSQHHEVSGFFPFFEKMIHPKVWISSFNIDLKNYRVDISGLTDSFWDLGQQLLIFKHEPLIKEVNLSGVSIGDKGNVNFSFSLVFSPNVFEK